MTPIRCGYNHAVIPVCPVCGPTERYVHLPVRLVAALVWRKA